MVTVVERIRGLGNVPDYTRSFLTNETLANALSTELRRQQAAAAESATYQSMPAQTDMLPSVIAGLAGFALGTAGMVALLRRRQARKVG